jgi:hypothetical protein
VAVRHQAPLDATVPLILDPQKLSPTLLEQVRRELREGLGETLESIAHPRGKVLDPASLETAADLVRSAIAVLDRPGDRDPAALAAETNLAYATLLAGIDLVKMHTDVPRVPPPRRTS